MSRVVWTEHRPKLEISNRPASWTDQLDHGRFTNEDGCRHHQQNLKVEAPHFHPPRNWWKCSPSNPSQSPHPKHWHLRVYCHGSCGLAKFVQRGGNDLKLNNGEKCRDQFSASKGWAMKTNHFLCSKTFNKSHQSQFEGQGPFQRLATPLSRVEWFCSCLLLFVLENSRPICPNLHTTKHWHLSVYWPGSCGLAKASKVRADLRGTWFETQQFERAVIKSMFYTRFYTSKDEKSMKNQHKPTHFLPKKARKSRKCRRRLPRLRAAAGAHCKLTRNSVGERSWWQNKWWKSMERWESMEIIHYPLIWQLDI